MAEDRERPPSSSTHRTTTVPSQGAHIFQNREQIRAKLLDEMPDLPSSSNVRLSVDARIDYVYSGA